MLRKNISSSVHGLTLLSHCAGGFKALVQYLFGAENVNKVCFRFATISELWHFYGDVTLLL
jgi:hypothetical protein